MKMYRISSKPLQDTIKQYENIPPHMRSFISKEFVDGEDMELVLNHTGSITCIGNASVKALFPIIKRKEWFKKLSKFHRVRSIFMKNNSCISIYGKMIRGKLAIDNSNTIWYGNNNTEFLADFIVNSRGIMLPHHSSAPFLNNFSIPMIPYLKIGNVYYHQDSLDKPFNSKIPNILKIEDKKFNVLSKGIVLTEDTFHNFDYKKFYVKHFTKYTDDSNEELHSILEEYVVDKECIESIIESYETKNENELVGGYICLMYSAFEKTRGIKKLRKVLGKDWNFINSDITFKVRKILKDINNNKKG